MTNRRHFLISAAGLTLGMTLAPWLRAQAAHATGHIICGTPGLVGKRLADGMATLVTNDPALNYNVETIDRDTTREAVRKVRSAPADGTVLLQTHSGPLVLAPAVYSKLAYSPLDDFKPIAFLGDFGFGLFVGPAVPPSVTSVDEYLRWMRQNPDYRDVGFTQAGSQSHLLAMLLGRVKVAPTRPQAYQSTHSLLNDLKTQAIAGAIASTGSVTEAEDAGIRLIAISSNEQNPRLKSIPTFTAQGLGDMDQRGWFGWFAPAGTDDSLIQELNARAAALISTPAYASLQSDLLLSHATLSTNEMYERMRAEASTYQGIVRAYGIPRLA